MSLQLVFELLHVLVVSRSSIVQKQIYKQVSRYIRQLYHHD